ncbi:hypothetical protein GL297_13635 [Komagataeibacter sp. FXV2]|nr:hypothetical protein [Komagataeibacter sp. FXV2]
MQTSDSNVYYEMLQQASRTVRDYCFRRGIFYEQYVGEKRNNMPWKAAYNRIEMLQSLLRENFSGWVLYMDADSYIADPNFDIFHYFSDKDHYAGIFSGHLNGVPYNINSGGFAINFNHPLGRQIVQDYTKEYNNISKENMNSALTWERDVPEDQFMLHSVIRRYVDDFGFSDKFLFEFADHSYVNNGPFISQVLRTFGNISDRVARIREKSDLILSENIPTNFDKDTIFSIHTSHPRISTIEHGRRFSLVHAPKDYKGIILWGPYISLHSGRYECSTYIYVSNKEDDRPVNLTLDVTANHGNTELSRKQFQIFNSGSQVLSIPFVLNENYDNIETRVETGGGAEIYFPRVNILRERDS